MTLNDGRDVVNLDDTLVDLKLGPDVLEVRAPRYYRNDRAVELDSRQQFLVRAGNPIGFKFHVIWFSEDSWWDQT